MVVLIESDFEKAIDGIVERIVIRDYEIQR